ncbi:hypothetical protein MRB53_030445 [Persea americana]|uniref:Uncharacterized protein n=1 Tax=Persea americana TaxID=3435 RepID=A0ACC2KLB5_PERAE|nr:hypothetical protein MRB53_030445 [Persea americana]
MFSSPCHYQRNKELKESQERVVGSTSLACVSPTHTLFPSFARRASLVCLCARLVSTATRLWSVELHHLSSFSSNYHDSPSPFFLILIQVFFFVLRLLIARFHSGQPYNLQISWFGHLWVLGVLGIGVGQLRLEGLGVFFELGDLRKTIP